MPSYHQIPRPSVPSYSSVQPVAQQFLMINTVDFLLINASGDRLLISDARDSGYHSISRPSVPSYHSIPKPS